MAGGEAVAIYVGHGVPDEALATLKVMKERMAEIPALEDSHDATIAQSNIHRFPRGMRGIDGSDGRYIVPAVVAIGPYHHDLPEVQEMKKVKLAAANRFFRDLNASVEDVYGKLLSVVDKARACYDDDDKIRWISDADFAAMMLVDGCFLLQLSRGCELSSDHSILKDVMLLENQIPWLVLETLVEFHHVDMHSFIFDLGGKYFPREEKKGWWSRLQARVTCQRGNIEKFGRGINGGRSYKSYQPAHLLSLLRFSQICHIPTEMLQYEAASSPLLSSSAVELAQMGVKVTASTAAWFADMEVHKGGIFGVFSLSPVFLNDVTACWLVNMAALEATSSGGYGDFVVSSYLSALAMMVDREEDVHQLRRRRVVLSTFNNTQTLDFFKRLSQHLNFGRRFFVVLEQIESYQRNRRVRIFLHKIIYNSYKTMTIASLVSIIAVLVGILKTLLSKKQQ